MFLESNLAAGVESGKYRHLLMVRTNKIPFLKLHQKHNLKNVV
jgi:hypothetical protein